MNLIGLGIFSIIFLGMLGIVSNTGESGSARIEKEMFLMNCPMPIYNGNVTDLDITGFTVIYNSTIFQSTDNFDGVFFECDLNEFSQFRVQAISKPYDTTLFSVIPIGWYGYLADWLSAGFESMTHLFTLIGYFVTPTGFNILGYSITDLTGIALMFVIIIYSICYISIGILIYKVVSPFSNGGS